MTKPKRMALNPGQRILTEGSFSTSSKYAHWCYDWDEMLIDETLPEFESCTCGVLNGTKPKAKNSH